MANGNPVGVLDRQGGKIQARPWSDLRVGDICRVERDQDFPADLLLLRTQGENGLCFVETANIDGETNLKLKQACRETMDLGLAQLAALEGSVACEAPNDRIYQFEGVLQLMSDKQVPLGPDQLLLRGSTLRNTPAIYGLVLYTGFETKMMLNAQRGCRLKQTTMDRLINQQLFFLFAMLLGMSLLSLLIFCLAHGFYARHLPYLMEGYQLTAGSLVMKLFTFIILFHSIVPISLMVTMEVVRMVLASLINSDLQLYALELDCPAQARNSTLVEELGQIEYVFSDKTGTLTRNQMTLKQVYRCAAPSDGNEPRETVSTGEVEGETLGMDWCLALCHTVIVDQPTGQYQGSSPDELAIVQWADRRITFQARTHSTITVEHGGQAQAWEWLACIEFTSDRRRMSVVVREGGGGKRLWLICKGADSVIMSRLRDQQAVAGCLAALEGFAGQGLRTLCYAAREIDPGEWREWLAGWQRAQAQVTGRQEALDREAERLEQSLCLVGCTGIEDRLQEGVPACLQALLKARIRVWVLTGDRMETALNVGIGAGLITAECRQVMIRGEGEADSLSLQLDRLTMQAAIDHAEGKHLGD